MAKGVFGSSPKRANVIRVTLEVDEDRGEDSLTLRWDNIDDARLRKELKARPWVKHVTLVATQVTGEGFSGSTLHSITALQAKFTERGLKVIRKLKSLEDFDYTPAPELVRETRKRRNQEQHKVVSEPAQVEESREEAESNDPDPELLEGLLVVGETVDD